MAPVRAFVGVELPGAVAHSLADAVDALETLGDRLRWVRPEGVHLTLKFLGDTDPGRIPGIQDKLTETLAPFAPFRLSLRVRWMCFPKLLSGASTVSE